METVGDNHRFTVLIDCSDRKGLVYAVSKILLDYGLNIVENREFVDSSTNRFFMRTVVEGCSDRTRLAFELAGILPEDAEVRTIADRPKNIAVLASTENHCLGDMLIRHEDGELSANIACVISNHDTLSRLVERFDLPFYHVSHEGLGRETHEDRLRNILNNLDFDYIILAKYMRILSPAFVADYRNRIINIHHSFLPAFIGANPYRRAFERGVKIVGATAHFVTEGLDEGPIIAQDVLSVDHTQSAKQMQRLGRDVEKIVLARAVRLVLEDRVFVNGNRTVVFA